MSKFQAKYKSHKVGSPFENGVSQGPQVSKVQFDKILGYIEEGKREGAELALGGETLEGKGYFVQPIVFTNVRRILT
jgi:aldehyde dehydrogenase (NAD+)